MSDTDKDIDWSKTTFEGSRREQLRRWCVLSVRERLEALDEMTDLAAQLAKQAPAQPSRTEVREQQAEYNDDKKID